MDDFEDECDDEYGNDGNQHIREHENDGSDDVDIEDTGDDFEDDDKNDKDEKDEQEERHVHGVGAERARSRTCRVGSACASRRFGADRRVSVGRNDGDGDGALSASSLRSLPSRWPFLSRTSKLLCVPLVAMVVVMVVVMVVAAFPTASALPTAAHAARAAGASSSSSFSEALARAEMDNHDAGVKQNCRKESDLDFVTCDLDDLPTSELVRICDRVGLDLERHVIPLLVLDNDDNDDTTDNYDDDGNLMDIEKLLNEMAFGTHHNDENDDYDDDDDDDDDEKEEHVGNGDTISDEATVTEGKQDDNYQGHDMGANNDNGGEILLSTKISATKNTSKKKRKKKHTRDEYVAAARECLLIEAEIQRIEEEVENEYEDEDDYDYDRYNDEDVEGYDFEYDLDIDQVDNFHENDDDDDDNLLGGGSSDEMTKRRRHSRRRRRRYYEKESSHLPSSSERDLLTHDPDLLASVASDVLMKHPELANELKKELEREDPDLFHELFMMSSNGDNYIDDYNDDDDGGGLNKDGRKKLAIERTDVLAELVALLLAENPNLLYGLDEDVSSSLLNAGEKKDGNLFMMGDIDNDDEDDNDNAPSKESDEGKEREEL